MKVYKIKNEPNKLFFVNYKRINEEEIFNEIKDVLQGETSIRIGHKEVFPTEDIYQCSVLDKDFELVYDMDYGGYIYSSSDKALSLIENILNNQ